MEQEKRPSWFKCVESQSGLFTVGVVYEVQDYLNDGRPRIMTNSVRFRETLPSASAMFEPFNPWAYLEPTP